MDLNTFLIAMLIQTGKVEQDGDIDPWLKKFKELDADGSGRLDQDDIALMEQQEQERLMGGARSDSRVESSGVNPMTNPDPKPTKENDNSGVAIKVNLGSEVSEF